MSYRLTKIYTRKGDAGFTKIGKKRLAKDHILIEVLGTIDELNSSLGLILAFPISKNIYDVLTLIQNDLFNFGGELCLPEHMRITSAKVEELEHLIDAWNQLLPPLKEFILPRGSPSVAATHMARTVCRRAERLLVTLNRKEPLANQELMRYINRLSDVLFVLARLLTTSEEILWNNNKSI